MKVEETSSVYLQAGYGDTDKDVIANIAFESVVGERSGYWRGLGAGIKPLKGKSVTGLQEQLEKKCEKRQGLEMKLKEVETQLEKERNMREQMMAKFGESKATRRKDGETS